MKPNQRILTFAREIVWLRCSPKNKILSAVVSHRLSGFVREPSQFYLTTRTPVGGNELKAARCTNATRRGALSLNYEPTMSALSDLAPENYLTLKETAAIYRVNPRTILRAIARKRFPQPLRIGTAMRFVKADLVAYDATPNGSLASPSIK